ncbi:MAG: hypothetical protein RRY26_11710 [Cellulosilyticaceae bacterium]
MKKTWEQVVKDSFSCDMYRTYYDKYKIPVHEWLGEEARLKYEEILNPTVEEIEGIICMAVMEQTVKYAERMLQG